MKYEKIIFGLDCDIEQFDEQYEILGPQGKTGSHDMINACVQSKDVTELNPT